MLAPADMQGLAAGDMGPPQGWAPDWGQGRWGSEPSPFPPARMFPAHLPPSFPAVGVFDGSALAEVQTSY